MKNLGLLLGACLLSAILSIAGYRYFATPEKIIIHEPSPAMYTKYNKDPIDAPARTFLSSSPTNFIAAAEVVTPTVVNIRASTAAEGDWWGGGAYSGSSGSGVIISSDGYIVTNNHVIEEGPDNIEVTLNDKRKFQAKLIGLDPSTDLALVKIEASGLSYLTLGNSDSIRIGEWVLAVGNPFNLESTVTAGIVSAKGRSIDILDDDYRVESFIQTDAAVNPGNSGGALVNTNGELVGINTAIITRSGRYEGYSFAIPSNLARKVIKDLRDYGVVQRAILGVRIDAVTAEMAEELGLRSIEGVYISDVNRGSGAEEAGLLPGDVIISINGVKTHTIPELQELIARFRPGNTVEVEYFRKALKRKAKVLLKNTSGTLTFQGMSEDAQQNITDALGFELRNLSKSEKKRLDTDGAYVLSITRGSKIERTNMDPGFVITKINEHTIHNVEDAVEALNNASGKIMLEGVYEGYPDLWYYAFPK